MKYDKTSIASIFEYSQKLIGHSLREVVGEKKLQASNLQGQGKGGLEQMIEELFFEYPINSDPGPDFKEAGLELKGTGLYKQKSGELQIKERLVCDMIDYCAVVEEDFDNSLFYLKCRIMLLIFYLYEKGVNKWDLRYIYTVIWQIPQKDLIIIKRDFNIIVNKIKAGEAHLLRRAAQSGGVQRICAGTARRPPCQHLLSHLQGTDQHPPRLLPRRRGEGYADCIQP